MDSSTKTLEDSKKGKGMKVESRGGEGFEGIESVECRGGEGEEGHGGRK